jgi:subtilase family serine protease
VCGQGAWEDDPADPCKERSEILKCLGGVCSPSGEYESRNKIIPDLVITEKHEMFEDGNFTVNYTVKNIGGGDANASNTTIYINTLNVLEDPVPALAAGKNHTNTVGPFECPCDGTLNITVCADNGDAVVECNETNNCKVNIVECPPCPKPDLNITNKFETLIDDNKNFTVNYTVKNIGAGDAGASNTTIYIDGVNVLEDPAPALTSGANYTNTVGPFQCPCSQTLNITVCADNDNEVNESNETNNCMINEFACPPCPKPDLNITDKFETLIDGGKNFTVNYTVKNIGDGAAGASNTTFFINGTNVLEDAVPALAAGANHTNTVGPFECPCSQTLNVTVCADNGDVVNESDETNNCMINIFKCPDTTPPEVVDYAPTGTNVPVTTNVTATFSEGVNEFTLNNETIIVKNSTGIRVEGIITYDSDNFTATFDPSSNLEYCETYNVTITTGVQDIAGNNMTSNITWNFTTWKPDLVISGQWMNWPENCTICYNITNIGNGTVLAGHNTTLYVDGNEQAHDEVPVNLAPNESYMGCFNWTFTSPQDNITVCADNNKTVTESNESNNCMSRTYKCGDVNEDGDITLWDVSLTWQDVHVHRTPINGWAEDADCNGHVTMWDVGLLWHGVYGSPINCCCMEN